MKNTEEIKEYIKQQSELMKNKNYTPIQLICYHIQQESVSSLNK